MSEKLKIFNGRILTPSGVISDGCVIIIDGRIKEVGRKNIELPDAFEIDAKGKYISPGFIDIHVHGGGGFDFMDATVEAFLEIACVHAKFGTTSMLPTTLTADRRKILDVLECYDAAISKKRSGAQFLGMHIEGPYISMNQKGAQDPRFIRNPDPLEYKEIISTFKNIKRWSAAPELNGALQFGAYLKANNILPSIAHTDATYADVLEAFNCGYTHITHFYSAMSGVTRVGCTRYAGVVESGYLIDDLTVEIITDGIHLPSPLLRLIHKVKGAERTALITDAIRATGTDATDSILGDHEHGVKVIIEDDVAKLPDRSCFAGSVATADRLIRTMVSLGGVTMADAVQMISQTPAEIIGVSEMKGSITAGRDADLVIFDEEVIVEKTIIMGRVEYSREDAGKNN